MGGCRCTYKNCSMKSDGVTHMFHYPVYEKVRCHQWLINAQKLEFLNLKVSQLKNRVVCQHHFKDDNFMNFLKDKLTFDAVPTLDGPYCDSSQLDKLQGHPKLYSISLEDIENDEYLTCNDKKANSSLKYGDFLTNCDLMFFNTIDQANSKILQRENDYEETNIILNEHIDRKIPSTNNQSRFKIDIDIFEPKDKDIFTIHLSEIPNDIKEVQTSFTSPNAYSVSAVPQTNNQVRNEKPPQKKNSTSKKGNRNIIILEEQTFSDKSALPLPDSIKLEPVCPSAILSLPNKHKKLTLNPSSIDSNVNAFEHNPVDTNTTLQNTINAQNENNDYMSYIAPKKVEHMNNLGQVNDKNLEREVEEINVNPQKTANNKFNKNNVKKSNSLFRNRISPERIAAIEEKRKFNMKLRDIIAECVDKIDNEETNKSPDIEKSKSKNKHGVCPCSAKNKPNMPDYTVALLETRMKRMEGILLKKIDQNSRRILELKNSVAPSHSKKSVHTQTIANEDEEKRQLYQQISKYLSSEANSLLYEELFINKYVQKKVQGSPKKRRKHK